MVKTASLEGRAWLSHEEGRPQAWKREMLARQRQDRAGLMKSGYIWVTWTEKRKGPERWKPRGALVLLVLLTGIELVTY